MAPQASSTLHLYAGKCRILKSWFESKDLGPMKATIPQEAVFLLHLFHDKKLSFKTMDGYRTAVARPIELSTAHNIGQDPMLLNLLKIFS